MTILVATRNNKILDAWEMGLPGALIARQNRVTEDTVRGVIFHARRAKDSRATARRTKHNGTQYRIRLTEHAEVVLQREADRRDMSIASLSVLLLETIAADNLLKAVIDDDH